MNLQNRKWKMISSKNRNRKTSRNLCLRLIKKMRSHHSMSNRHQFDREHHQYQWIHRFRLFILLIHSTISSTSHHSSIEWPSSWIEPELGRSTLGLGRVEHSVSARRIEPDKHFWSRGLIEFEFLFDELNRTRIFVRSNVQLETVVWVKIRVECSIHELNDRLRFRIESEHADPSEPESWASSRASILGLGSEVLFVGSNRIEKKCPNSTRRSHYSSRYWKR
jgi:hypothetical protein